MKLPIYQMASLSADQIPFFNAILSHIIHAVNTIEFGNIGSSENIWCTFVVVDGGEANEVCSASHLLHRVPNGTIVVWQDTASILYKPTDATSADTSTEVFYAFNTSGSSLATSAVSAVLLLI